jgi:hypothetical protein
VGDTGFDLQAILTHEAGHFFGLAHSTDTSAIMYALYQRGAIALTTDDVNAICDAQPSAPATPSGCALAARGGVTAGETTFALLPGMAILALVRRRRVSRRTAVVVAEKSA